MRLQQPIKKTKQIECKKQEEWASSYVLDDDDDDKNHMHDYWD